MTPITIDGRSRFREIYNAVREDHGTPLPYDRPVDEALLRHGDDSPPTDSNPVYLGIPRLPLHFFIVPGLVADCVGKTLSPFVIARRHLETHGFHTSVLTVNGRSSSEYNAAQINAALSHYPGDERFVFLGYSKGAVDVLQALTEYPKIAHRTAAVVSVAGSIGGSPLADSSSGLLRWLVKRLPLPTCKPGDGLGIESLLQDTRRRWLNNNPLPKHVCYFSLVALPRPERVSRILKWNYRRLATIDPNNDSQVLRDDAIIPDSILLGYVNADHWALALPITLVWPLSRVLLNHNDFPREILLESIVRNVEEILLTDTTLTA